MTVLFISAFLPIAQAGGTGVTGVPLLASSSKGVDSDSVYPNPRFSPADVVRIQVDALGKNDVPHENAGIEIAFRFASPGNKHVTGPLTRFIQLVSNPVYRPMLNHRKADYGKLEVEGTRAVQSVILTASNGERVGYLFALSRQQGGHCDACWMTDSVIRFEVRDEQNRLLTI